MFLDGSHVPAIAVTGAGFGESSEMRTQFQGAVIAVFEEGLAVNAEEFLCFVHRKPAAGGSHDVKKRGPSYGIESNKPVKVL